MKQPAARAADPAPIEYEPGLVEETARWALEHGGPAIESLKLHRLRLDHRRKLDALYQLAEGERREAAFRDHFATLFAELGTASWIPRWLELFPRLRSELSCIIVRAASGAGEEGAELWESRERCGEGIPAYLVIAVSGTGLHDHDELRVALLPDLLRAADLLEPGFGFRAADLRAETRASEERTRALYQKLWELSARARLQDRGLREDDRLAIDAEELIAGAAARLAGGADGLRRDAEELLAALCGRVSHPWLIGMARSLPEASTTGDPGAAARCPLCHYPTTDWASADALRAVEPEVRADFPAWSNADGGCGHCAERYALLAEPTEVAP